VPVHDTAERGNDMHTRRLILAALWSAAACAGEDAAPAAAAPTLEGTPEPAYASCAAFYFTSANGKAMKDYDDLYRAGEDTLNAAKKELGRDAGERAMETASGQMMKAIDHNWQFVDALGTKYRTPCAEFHERAKAATAE
jgi:hypothetical protein